MPSRGRGARSFLASCMHSLKTREPGNPGIKPPFAVFLSPRDGGPSDRSPTVSPADHLHRRKSSENGVGTDHTA